MTARTQFVALERVSRTILVVRGEPVILDRELAAIYGVSTGRLNQAVKRNPERFPADFMFQLTARELERSLAALDAKTQRQFNDVYEAIRALMIPSPSKRRGMGFTADLGGPVKR